MPPIFSVSAYDASEAQLGILPQSISACRQVRPCRRILLARVLHYFTSYKWYHCGPSTTTRGEITQDFHSLKLFCRCREFQFSVLEMLSIQSSLARSSGSTAGNGYLEAEMVT